MNCKNCGGALVKRETLEYPIDSNGVYALDENQAAESGGVYCAVCGAGHDYEEIHESGDRITVALEANSDPKPVATIALGFRGGVVDDIGAEQMVGLIAIDEDGEKVGMFLARPFEDNAWWKRAMRLASLIKKGEWQASFAEEENDG